ncbi:beta-ketoacyl-[acyl-carrier-protein] synthase family protein [Thalassoroseus pseudoceratinae]|uniref:beta-ketoacyl-[acyl-carrier-protein] synthase family protein n=1 Tax=Thalassoroseus pseudoceratinae TaxID=2713176 RepID=UPI0014226BDC|nr:beta-ketoacyl-[acyl-carrier-protein] synthase family protein [Thalassoroseus pseudoceratinae]
MAQQSSDITKGVVITGVGIVSPLGIGRSDFSENLAAGRSGIRRSQLQSFTGVPGHVGGEISEFDEKSAKKQWLKSERKWVKVMCREIQLGVASALQAVEDAQVSTDTIPADRLGVEFGANLMLTPPDQLIDPVKKSAEEEPSPHFIYEKWGQDGENAGQPSGMGAMEPLWLLKYLPNMPACHISISVGARGPSNSITMDEASGNSVLGEAVRIISRGDADVMISGTCGARFNPMQSLHAALWDELAHEDGPPETWCRPFDKNSTGQVIGEGAATLILETAEHAANRGATVFGEILGFGSSCVVERDGSPQPRRALANAMRAALRDAGVEPNQIGHVNAHGLGSKAVDRDEALAIHDVFGADGGKIPVTAMKSRLGNAGPGCGTMELVASLVSLGSGVIPVTLNYRASDPECPLNVVHGEPLPTDNRLFLKTNVTRVGQATAVVVRAAGA